jgi:hypothetical protein
LWLNKIKWQSSNMTTGNAGSWFISKPLLCGIWACAVIGWINGYQHIRQNTYVYWKQPNIYSRCKVYTLHILTSNPKEEYKYTTHCDVTWSREYCLGLTTRLSWWSRESFIELQDLQSRFKYTSQVSKQVKHITHCHLLIYTEVLWACDREELRYGQGYVFHWLVYWT